MKKKIFIALMASVSLFALAACGSGNKQVTAGGSTALQPMVEHASMAYMKQNPDEIIMVQGGGSGVGLAQVAAGSFQIGNSDIFAEEKSGIAVDKIIDHKVAVIGFAPIINKKLKVSNLTQQELIDIFTGKITNWKEVGGNDQKIVLLNRAAGSGTRGTFEKWIMDGETAIPSQEQDSSGMVRSIVSDTPGAISYVAFSYVTDDVNVLSIDGVAPTDENVTTNDWKVWAYEHMYTKGEPTALTAEFLEYILSDEVQEHIVGDLGYIPISRMQVERDWEGNVIK